MLFYTFLGGAPTSICHFSLSSMRLSVQPSVCCTPCLRKCTSSNHDFWYTCVKWWYLQALFSFFFFFFSFTFLGCLGGKRAKSSPKLKIQLHLSHAISQEQYSILSWFLVHLCKMMVSPGSDFILEYFNFSGC